MEGDPIYIWRYELRSRGGLNALSERRDFPGALIRVGDGYGCLHPWPELGDPGLRDLLEQLAAGGREEPLLQRALYCAATDGKARREGVSLFDGFSVPDSYASLGVPSDVMVEGAVRRGFRAAKVKGSSDWAAEAERLNRWSHEWPKLSWRVDFNGSLSFMEATRLGECLTDRLRERIDYIEDPCPYDVADWAELSRISGLRLAMDLGAGPEREVPVLVIKPAKDFPVAYRATAASRDVELAVTSYMDHPLGQCFAAFEAARLATEPDIRVALCGLQTHGLFEENEFSERLGKPGPRFTTPEGSGLGFDDLLEALPWKRLR
jgi:O-succinylbenzoate synthase